ncbi:MULTISPECIES: type I polyketide synthase [unclassified Nocardiopsis]|uniref:type I polyketide synthase n=1 Tax=unclassified Nocardiopsis TaxID=2649073 RepID=UPI000A8AC74A|nr:type I polyketide synthase [Nocardiopsis sp. TSRI0078]
MIPADHGKDTREVAVVGLASRLPGAPDPGALWNMLTEGRHAIGPVPADRWDATAQLDPEKHVQSVGGFLDGVADFDPVFFGISPREAADIDPQQRLFLEAAWRALEDGGQTAARLRGTRCGVYVGASWHDYEILRKERGAPATQHSAVGNAPDVIAARVSYFLGLTGPSMTVETGCSSAMVALHLASQAIRHGEVDSALVGGVNLILAPDVSIGLTHFGGLSDRGLCQAFSADADGFVRGEGVVALHLKPLDAALADGDRIHAVLAGTAVNNDGGGDSLASPNPAGQEDLLRTTYTGLGLSPDRLAYVEAHGTGTPKGDPIEAEAIGRVLGATRSPGAGPLRIGSVKTNIGHLEATAGLAGLVKVILALRHRTIPASLHAETLNPAIAFDELNVSPVRTPVELPGDEPLYMAVNSFGWGGTNAHAVLTTAPETARPGTAEPVPALLTALSAHSEAALRQRAGDLADALTAGELDVAGAAGTLARRRDHLPVRAALLATEPAELAEGLRSLADGTHDPEESEDVVTGHPGPVGRVAFVFPGQGSQWVDMGRELYEHAPVFREAVDRCGRALSAHVDWDLAEVVTGGAGAAWTDRVDMVQPVLWATSVGLAELWRAAGVDPDVVVGHSQGEVAAATVSGALSYEDAARVVALRSSAVRAIAGKGLMMAVELDRDAAQRCLEGFEEFVSLAVNNGPTSCVLSGESDSVLMLKELLEADGVDCRLVKVDYASHSPQVDEVSDDLVRDLADVAPREGEVPMMSTVEARVLTGAELDAEYWVANLRRPVRFAESVGALLDDGVTHVVEVSAHPILAMALEGLVGEHGTDASVLTTLRRNRGTTTDLARAFARAYTSGLEPLAHVPADVRAELPPYPWQRTRYWVPEARRRTGGGTEPILSPLTVEQDAWQGEVTLDVRDQPWIDDHRVHDAVVLPGAGMLALALATARARGGALPRDLVDVRFLSDLTLAGEAARLAVLWRDDVTEGGSFTLMSLPEGAGGWTTHATARVHHTSVGDERAEAFPEALRTARAGDVEAFYDACTARGLHYGPAFRVVTELRHDETEALGRLGLDGRVRVGARPHGLHPALWDGALQVTLALCGDGATVVPTGVDRVTLHHDLAEPVLAGWSHAVRRDTHLFDLTLFDDAERPLMTMRGLRLSPLQGTEDRGAETERLHRMTYVDRPAPGPAGPGAWAVVGDPADGTGDLARALEAAGAAVHRGRTMDEVSGTPVDAVVHVAPSAARGLDAQRAGITELTGTVRACAGRGVPPRLTVLTHGAQAADPTEVPDPGAALYWGFARVLRREHGELTPRVVDVAGPGRVTDAVAELLADDGEDQVLVRSGRRLVGRLAGGPDESGPVPVAWATPRRPHRLTSDRPGLWERLVYRPLTTDRPGPGEVRVRVEASALNFIDVMKALGTYPDPSGGDLFGGECAGHVTDVGEGVTGFEPGQRVAACVFGAIASHVTLRADHVRVLPDHLGAAEAATLPLAAMTAWYGLRDLARLEEGETVLVHSAAGGLGQAAVQVARSVGAHVIATAGSEDKRRTLRESGIEHVFDSRDLSWADGVLGATGGRGVDVVLNSLSGAAIGLGVRVLAEDGRFVEVGKKDIYQGRSLNLSEFRKGVSFAAVDLAGLMTRRPERFARLFDRVWAGVCEGTLTPLPYITRPFAEAADALRDMARGVHVGKIVLTDPDTVTSIAPEAMPGGSLRADGRYLVTGGLGALGLSLAEHMAERGAGALALVGRSGPTAEAQARIEALRGRGAKVTVVSADVTDAVSVEKLLAELREDGTPLCGVVHAAGVLDDATIDTLTPEAVERVIGPKVDGARHLDALTGDDPLDFFLLFSSAAALVGNVGQAAYAAANTYLDSLAVARRHRGLPALSVQWGPFTDVGLAAADANRGDRLADRGMGGFTADEAWRALDGMLAADTPVTGYVPLNLRRWFDAYPETAAQPSWELLKDRADSGGTEGDEFRVRVLAADPDERPGLVEAKVRELAGRVLRLESDAIDRRVPFKELGLDSLMSLELRNRLEVAFGLKLSPTLLWTYGSTEALAAVLDERLTTSA